MLRPELLCSTSLAPGIEGGHLHRQRHRCLNCSTSLSEFIDLKVAAAHHNPQELSLVVSYPWALLLQTHGH